MSIRSRWDRLVCRVLDHMRPGEEAVCLRCGTKKEAPVLRQPTGRGIIANTGDGSENFDPEQYGTPETLHTHVVIKKSADHLIAAAQRMRGDGAWPIMLVGSSAGTPAMMEAVYRRPELWVGGVAIVSGSGRWQYELRAMFARAVQTAVLQQRGSDDLEWVAPVQDALERDMIREDVDFTTRIYPWQRHGFLGRHKRAQDELAAFIAWQLYARAEPAWWGIRP